MRDSIIIKDDFCADIALVKQSALESGFGKWTPNAGLVGNSIYEGMNFVGRHDLMLRSLYAAIGRPIFPSALFFRATKNDTTTYIHSDRSHGDWTCLVYLTDHKDVSGTAFYRHTETGLTEMPTFEEQHKLGIFQTMKADMESRNESRWQQLDFIRGNFNRALIFHAPLFHSRIQKLNDETTDRLIWGCHFFI